MPSELSWREKILREFTPHVARLTLVEDPDGLLSEEGVLAGIRERGFTLLPFEDHVAFRYAYEAKFRVRWDEGEQAELVVVLRSLDGQMDETLPFDLLQAGRRLAFNLGDIFPGLSYPVVAALDRSDLDALSLAYATNAPSGLSENATKDFVLRHVYQVAPELIREPADLLRMLLRRHYYGRCLPALLDERLVTLLRQNACFGEWPLERLVTRREDFFRFLQERWPTFVDSELGGQASHVREAAQHRYTVPGPADLPFAHHDVRVYIDNLFAEGLLSAVQRDDAARLPKTWLHIGIKTVPGEDRSRRLEKLVATLRSSVPSGAAKYTEWLHFARGWAELLVLVHQPGTVGEGVELAAARELKSSVEEAFTAWLLCRYAGLANLPPVPPVMLHHVPRMLARLADDEGVKVALLVIDGLAMDQWLIVQRALAARVPEFRFREQAVFAWLPTLTSVSRQAVFAGKIPGFFPSSIHTTAKEPALWRQFWAEQGCAAEQVEYIKGLGEGSLAEVAERLSHPEVRVVGLVVDKVDKIAHGIQLGTAGLHNQIEQWAKQPYLGDLICLLLERGFRVYLTSDHGNTEATGCGSPAEGSLAELKGERVRVYADASLRNKVKDQFAGTMPWPATGLPENFLALFAPPGKAFIGHGERAVCHGGNSLAELIVPLVQIDLPLPCALAGKGSASC